MATVSDYGGAGTSINLCTSQTGNGQTTNVGDRGFTLGPAVVRIATVAGSTPTCTYLIEGSYDGTVWVPLIIADSATPTTLAFATFTITSTTTATKVIQANQPHRYVRVTMSSNTNITNTIDLFPY